MLNISIDVTLVDKSFLRRVVRSSGEPAVFLDLTLFETPRSEFGDYLVKQDIGQEARLMGLVRPILGNAKIVKNSANKEEDRGE